MNIYKISKKEILLNLNNKWILFSAVFFLMINLTIIYFNDFISGDYSQTDNKSLSLSIIHLEMYIIPLLSFILSYDSILYEKENGTLDLILSYIIKFSDIFFGKLLGNSTVFAMSVIIGFSPIAIYLNFFGINLSSLIKFLFFSIWLNIIFTFFSLIISNFSKDRTIVILMSIFIWLFFVFIYDIIFILLTTFLYGLIDTNFLSIILFLNPAELFRMISIFNFMPNDAVELFGIKSGLLNIIYIYFAMFIWLFLIIIISIFYCKKR